MERKTEEGWQELQSHIERFFARSLQAGGKSIEYKPRFMGLLAEGPAEQAEKET